MWITEASQAATVHPSLRDSPPFRVSRSLPLARMTGAGLAERAKPAERQGARSSHRAPAAPVKPDRRGTRGRRAKPVRRRAAWAHWAPSAP